MPLRRTDLLAQAGLRQAGLLAQGGRPRQASLPCRAGLEAVVLDLRAHLRHPLPAQLALEVGCNMPSPLSISVGNVPALKQL
jgi:hypothetical protein